jgi:hypothetical protein
MLLNERQKGQDEEGDVNTYWTTFRKREGTGI